MFLHPMNNAPPNLLISYVHCHSLLIMCSDIDRDVVSISLSYFDRYLSRHTSIDETLYQLVAMTSLYVAVKLHSTRKISVASMVSIDIGASLIADHVDMNHYNYTNLLFSIHPSDLTTHQLSSFKSALSKGHFRVDQILKMEICLIKTLRWRLNPHTPAILLNIACPIIDATVNSISYDPQTSYEITELSRYLLELSVCDGFFSDKKPSSVTCASIMVAMEHLSTPESIKMRFASYNLDKAPDVTELCAQRLRHVYSLAIPTKLDEIDPPRATSSPTSVLD